MTSLVRQSGWVDAERNTGKRVALQTSTGSTILVIQDPNAGAPPVGWGARDNITRLYVYESTNTPKTTWALRATITAPAATTFVDNWQGWFSADLYNDNSIGIVAKATTGAIYYCKVTTATWAVGAWETVATSAGITFVAIDLAISETDAPLIAAYYTSPTSGNFQGVKLLLRRTTPGTWLEVNQQIGSASGGVPRDNTWDVSVTWVKGGVNTARDFAYAFSVTKPSQDAGVLLYTGVLNETSATAVTGHNLRGTYTLGDVSFTTNYTYKARNILLFPKSAAGKDFILTTQSYYPKPKLNICSWSNSTGSWVNTAPLSTSNSTASTSINGGMMTQTAGGDYVTFFTNVIASGGGELLAYPVSVIGSGPAVWGPPYVFNDAIATSPYFPVGGTGKRAYLPSNHEIVYGKRYSSGKYDLVHDFVVPLRAPASHTPANNEVVTTSVPALSVAADLDRNFSQGRIKVVWQFASDAGFTTNLRTYTQADSKFQSVNDTLTAGKTVTIRDTLPGVSELFQGVWYFRAAQINEYGMVSPWDTATHFTVSHPPSASIQSPGGYANNAFGSGDQEFRWSFSDPYVGDGQTAFQVIIERVDTGAGLYDSGKVVSTAQAYVQTFVSGDKNLQLRWKVRVWDGDDVPGNYSDYGLFTLIDAATIAFNSPTSGGTVTTALPAVNFTLTIAGGRVVMKYKFIISQGNTTVFDSGWVAAPLAGWPTGTVLAYTNPTPVLQNNTAYTYQIRAVDNVNSEARASIQATTSWTLPSTIDSVAVDLTTYNQEDAGYAKVVWTEATIDADFRAWVVMRRDRLIDPQTGANLEVGAWTPITYIYDSGIFEYHDFYAPSGYGVDYDVLQMVDRFGDQIMSAFSAGVSVIPKSEGYWFIVPDSVTSIPDAFKLSSVTADTYSDEYEETVYNIIDGGRKQEIGQHLGPSGTLTAQLRDSAGQSARQKKRRLETMKEQGVTNLYMRTPFGDLYRVGVSNLGVSRIAGVGTSEFVDVTIPYMEVGA